MPLTRNAFMVSWRSPAILQIFHRMFARAETRFSGGKNGTLFLYTTAGGFKIRIIFIQFIIRVVYFLTKIK
jgi:hypothetical protein